MKRELQVKEIGTGNVIHTIDVTGKSDSTVERVISGMLIEMDTDRFFVADTADDEES